MGGGLLQLVAYGAQDVYLSGNPQITFFKVAYRRHTNFSMESIEQTFNGTADFGRRVTCQISRNGDLIHRMYLQVALTGASFPAKAYAGLALVKSVELEIGGQRIDKQYGDWMYIWNELSLPVGKMTGFKDMVGGGDSAVTTTDTTMFIPLEFWFCRNPGLALPLIALQYHEVKVNLEFDTMKNASITAGTMGTASLWVDYIFLDTDERRRFAQLSHEYLIEQLQFTGEETITGVSNKVKLNFNHPVKELVWVMQADADSTTSTISNFGCYDSVGDGSSAAIRFARDGVNLTTDAKLQLNGHDRFAVRTGKYFNMVQPFQHHENIPANKGINVYSFALKPEEHQPSGTLNFSRIDSAVLNVSAHADAKKIRVYAVNYNVLRVMSGMGGLAYSN
jgi:hypothetical protein